MKKRLFTVLILFPLIFQGCSSDDDSNEENETITQEEISGVWLLASYILEDGESLTSNGDEINVTAINQVGKNYDMSLRLDQESGTVISNGTYDIDTAFSEQDGTPIETITSTITNQFNGLPYEINGNTIILQREGNSDVLLRVIAIESDRFVFSVSLGSLSSPPENTTVTGRAVFTFGK